MKPTQADLDAFFRVLQYLIDTAGEAWSYKAALEQVNMETAVDINEVREPGGESGPGQSIQRRV